MNTETRNITNDYEWLLMKQLRDHATVLMYECYDNNDYERGDQWGYFKDQAQFRLEARYNQIIAGE